MENIDNKIVTIEKIVEISQFFESNKNKYVELFNKDKIKNENLSYDKQDFEYYGTIPKVEYTVYFMDGRILKENSYDWFISMLVDKKFIKRIDFYLDISYSSDNIERTYKSIATTLILNADEYEDKIRLNVYSNNLESEANIFKNELTNIINTCEPRYNKIVKYSKFIIQTFCITIGLILSYIIYGILLVNMDNLDSIFVEYLENKYVLIIGQWLVAIILGNVVSYGIIYSLYKLILPKVKYSGYNSSNKSIYKEDINEFIEHSEIQLGRFSTASNLRKNIEKTYKYT